MNKRASRFENPWTEKENENLRPFIDMPISVAAADPAVRKIVNARGKRAVAQKILKLRDQREQLPHAGRENGYTTKRKYQRRKKVVAHEPATASTGTPLNFCPGCGCNLLAVRAALTL